MNTYNKPSHYFVFDVESVGLHGHAFAVAGGVFAANGAEQYGFQFAVDLGSMEGTTDDLRWVEENVPMLEPTHRTPKKMRDAFWEEWERAKKNYPGIVAAADCGWPVEARFLCACIDDDPEVRRWSGPYPFLEISSVLLAAGMDPLANYDRLPSETPKHHPYADAVQSARLLSEALAKLESEAGRSARAPLETPGS